MGKIRPGVYRHYKGKYYDVYGEAISAGNEDSGTEVFAVIYRPQYGDKRLIYYRLKTEFMESVTVEGETMPRFVFVRDFTEPCLVGITQFFSG